MIDRYSNMPAECRTLNLFSDLHPDCVAPSADRRCSSSNGNNPLHPNVSLKPPKVACYLAPAAGANYPYREGSDAVRLQGAVVGANGSVPRHGVLCDASAEQFRAGGAGTAHG